MSGDLIHALGHVEAESGYIHHARGLVTSVHPRFIELVRIQTSRSTAIDTNVTSLCLSLG